LVKGCLTLGQVREIRMKLKYYRYLLYIILTQWELDSSQLTGNVLRTLANVLARFSSDVNAMSVQSYLVFNNVLKTLSVNH